MQKTQHNWGRRLFTFKYRRSVQHYFSTEYFLLCCMSAGIWTLSRLTSRLSRPLNNFSTRLRLCICPDCTPHSHSIYNFNIMQFRCLSLSNGSCLGPPERPNLGRTRLTKLLSLAHTYLAGTQSVAYQLMTAKHWKLMLLGNQVGVYVLVLTVCTATPIWPMVESVLPCIFLYLCCLLCVV